MENLEQNHSSAESEHKRELTAADRCDVCGAQAFIRAVLTSGDLVFCGHHGLANEEKLKPIALFWQDESDKIA